jgi:hypothetical protein
VVLAALDPDAAVPVLWEASLIAVPPEASAPVCYGPRIKALGIYLVSYQHLPCERAAELLSDWLGGPVSVGSLLAWVAAGAAGLEGFLEEIRARLECTEVAHFDETGGRVDGRLRYVL